MRLLPGLMRYMALTKVRMREQKRPSHVGMASLLLAGLSAIRDLLPDSLGRIAVREESVRHDLGGLSPRGVVVRQEVWSVGGWHTLPCRWCTAWVPTHHLVQYQAVDVSVEWTFGLRPGTAGHLVSR